MDIFRSRSFFHYQHVLIGWHTKLNSIAGDILCSISIIVNLHFQDLWNNSTITFSGKLSNGERVCIQNQSVTTRFPIRLSSITPPPRSSANKCHCGSPPCQGHTFFWLPAFACAPVPYLLLLKRNMTMRNDKLVAHKDNEKILLDKCGVCHWSDDDSEEWKLKPFSTSIHRNHPPSPASHSEGGEDRLAHWPSQCSTVVVVFCIWLRSPVGPISVYANASKIVCLTFMGSSPTPLAPISLAPLLRSHVKRGVGGSSRRCLTGILFSSSE